MAKISFSIDSVFNGEGFQRANNSVQNLANTANKVQGPLRQIGGALGQLPGEAGKAATAVSGVVNAFKSVGIAGGVFAVAQVAFDMWANHVKAGAEKVKEAAEKAAAVMKDKLAKVSQDILGGVAGLLKKVGSEADASNKSINEMADSIKKVNEAMGKTDSATEAANVAELKYKIMIKLTEAESEAAKALAEAEGNLEVALLERANGVNEATRNLKLAEDNKNEMDRRMEVANKNLEDAKAAEAKAKEDLAHWDIEAMQGTKELEAAKKAMQEAEELVARRNKEYVKSIADSQVAIEEVQQAYEKKRQTEYAHDTKVMEVTKTLDDLKKSQDEDKKAHEKAAEIREQVTEAEQEYAAAVQTKKALLESEKARRKEAVERLAKAQEDSAEWEKNKLEMEDVHYTKLQQVNLEHLKHSVNLNEKQKEAIEKYDKWLKAQGSNPFKEMITNVTAEISQIDDELKQGVLDMDQQIKDLGTNLKDLNDSLTSCVKLK